MLTPTEDNSSSTNSPAVTNRPQRRSAGAKKKQEQVFRARKNQQFQHELTSTLFTRLRITDPTNLASVKLISAVIPARIPVSLRAIPQYLHELWERMIAIGTRPFQALVTPENKAIFFKVCLTLFEAKVCYAQRLVEQRPPFDMPTQFVFSEMALRKIKSVGERLPFPLVIALEALGNFAVDKQSVVPVFIKSEPEVVSGVINFSRTDIKTLVQALKDWLAVDDVIVVVAQELACLPNIAWENREHNGVQQVRLSQESVAFWSELTIQAHDREVFLKIVASLESKKDFIMQVDISTGVGSAVAGVRYFEPFNSDEQETLYYMNTLVSDFDEKLSGALMYGYEHRGLPFSRFVGTYDECLKHGTSCQSELRHAVIWASH